MTTICINVSLLFACISFVKPFLDSIETGHLASRIQHGNMGTSYSRSQQARTTLLRYARMIFNGDERDSGEQASALVHRAQQPAQGAESIELKSFGARAESHPPSKAMEIGTGPIDMSITRRTDVVVETEDRGDM